MSGFAWRGGMGSAAPRNLVVIVAGTPIRASAAVIASTAWPSDSPGARSQPIVAAGNCDTRAISSGADPSSNVATVESGTEAPPEVWI